MTATPTDSLLQQAIPANAREDWARHYAEPLADGVVRDQAALVFRLGAEWLALPARLFVGAADPGIPHRLPHRGGPGLLGIVCIRGQLYPCIALETLLGIAVAEAAPLTSGARGFARHLLVTLGHQTYAFAVDEVMGLQRYARAELHDAPSTVSGQLRPFLWAVLDIEGRQVGVLVADRLEQMMQEALL
ncbi:MAG: chemotaxis protein CheW [Pseudomonas sp.]|uniref:chemotaxis protein CheW n=1 Tax=Pseudomonas sp. TaxID=306 RepID=UPI0033948C6F